MRTDLNVFKEKLKSIKLVATDFDGVLTDGTVLWDSRGGEARQISFYDIMGISLLIKSGYHVAIISGERNSMIDRLASKFDLVDVHQGVKEKHLIIRELAVKYSFPKEAICYLGDDVNDLPAFQEAGVCVTVPDAPAQVRQKADYVTARPGGRGALREATDLILESRD